MAFDRLHNPVENCRIDAFSRLGKRSCIGVHRISFGCGDYCIRGGSGKVAAEKPQSVRFCFGCSDNRFQKGGIRHSFSGDDNDIDGMGFCRVRVRVGDACGDKDGDVVILQNTEVLHPDCRQQAERVVFVSAFCKQSLNVGKRVVMVKILRYGVVQQGGDLTESAVNAGTDSPELSSDIDGIFCIVIAHRLLL